MTIILKNDPVLKLPLRNVTKLKYGFKTKILLVLVAVLSVTTLLNVLLASMLTERQNQTAAYTGLDRSLQGWSNDLNSMINAFKEEAILAVNDGLVLEQHAEIDASKFTVTLVTDEPENHKQAINSLGYRKIIAINRLHLILNSGGFSSISVYNDNQLSHYVSKKTVGLSLIDTKKAQKWISAEADELGNFPFHLWPRWKTSQKPDSNTLDMNAYKQPTVTIGHPSPTETSINIIIPVQGVIQQVTRQFGKQRYISELGVVGDTSKRLVSEARDTSNSAKTFTVLIFSKILDQHYLQDVNNKTGNWPMLFSVDGQHQQRLLEENPSLSEIQQQLTVNATNSNKNNAFYRGTVNSEIGSYYVAMQDWQLDQNTQLMLAMASPREPTLQNIRETVTAILLVTGMILLMSIVVGVFWINRYTDPLIKLTAAAKDIIPNDTQQGSDIHQLVEKLSPIEIDAPDELGELTSAFNSMISELRLSFEMLEDRVQQRSAELLIARDQAEAANRAKSTFLANVSHELRTPLNAILGFSELLSGDESLNPDQKDNLSIINNSGRDLLLLINDVLDMAKIEAGHIHLEIEDFDLSELIQSVIKLMRIQAQQKNLQLTLEQSSEFPRFIKADRTKLRQILINLIGNAIKFTEKGEINLNLGIHNGHPTHVILSIEITDTGIGIKDVDQQRIFKPFEQVSNPAMQKGTGLGLALTKQFIELMDGTIEVSSVFEQGSTFIVEIPVIQLKQAEKDIKQPLKGHIVSLAKNQPQWRILIAEDHAENRLLIDNLLTRAGFKTRLTTNGLDAVEAFKQWQPDLICMDRRMPLLDGLEAIKRIKNLKGGDKVKIICITASVLKEDRMEAINIGADDFLQKPYHADQVFEAIARQLGAKYTYEDESKVIEKSTAKMSVDDIMPISNEWLERFIACSRLGDTEAMLELADSLDADQSDLKDKLKYHINQFQVKFLIDLFELARRSK
jgi:signal transduction histidine kinase/CheY-like chemotaxis protein